MSKLRILIADDEPLALSRLRTLFDQVSGCEIVATAADGRAALAAIAQKKPDLVMLDIQMPELSGLAVALDLPEEDRPDIIFVTAFEQFAPDAFEVDAVDYLLKPVRFDRLRQAIDRARRRRALREAAALAPACAPGDGDAIWVQVKDGMRRVSVQAIEWIEAARDYVMLHTPERSYIHRTTMAALEQSLDSAQLMRVHRSAFVRLDLVEQIRREPSEAVSVVLRSGVQVRVGPNYAAELLKKVGAAGA